MTLAARQLAFGFGDRALGKGVDMEIASSQVVCLLGPNGSGKTTLLRTLLGLLRPVAGRVLLDGRDLGDWPARERAMRIAYVPQAAESYFDFSVREMVEMGRTAHRGAFARPSPNDRERTQRSLERLRIAGLAERPIHRVSGGERQLTLIARALATEAPMLVLDEPTANLDFANQWLILEEIGRLGRSGASVIFSSHHPDHALRIADRVLMLREGAVIAWDQARAVVTSANLSRLYGRSVEVVEVRLADGSSRQTCVVPEAPGP